MTLRSQIITTVVVLLAIVLLGYVMSRVFHSCTDDGRVTGRSSCYYKTPPP